MFAEEEMEARLLRRGLSSGRSDDNVKTIAKRFHTFVRESMPVVQVLKARRCLRCVDASGSEEDVFKRVCDEFEDQRLCDQLTKA